MSKPTPQPQASTNTMSKMNTKHVSVTVNITYAGLQLPVYETEEGKAVTPLKPISDLFGLRWNDQLIKLSNGKKADVEDSRPPDIPVSWTEFAQDLGVCKLTVPGTDGKNREQMCIRLDRVVLFLMSISPERVRSGGNESGAAYLRQKKDEWADALHDYEEIGVAVNLNHAKTQAALMKQHTDFAKLILARAKVEDKDDRIYLGRITKQWAQTLGVAHQPDLIDGV